MFIFFFFCFLFFHHLACSSIIRSSELDRLERATMADEMEDKSEGHQDDTEQEIESQASHSLGKDEATAIHQYVGGGRRSSLDRSRTMPAPSWEEGDQILKAGRVLQPQLSSPMLSVSPACL